MRKQQIIAIVIVLLLAGGVAAGYQFYFRPAVEKFSKDQKYLADLNTKIAQLKSTFPSGKPESTVDAVRAKIQPWNETIAQRAAQFTLRDFKKIDPLPKTNVLKEYYEKTASKVVTDLYTELATKGVYYRPTIDFYFGVARPGTLTGRRVNEQQVTSWLETLKLGTSMTRLLIDSDIMGVDNIVMWTPRKQPSGLTSYAVGVSMWMSLDQFCRFVERLQSDETMTISIQGFRMTNTALRAYQDPPLKIDLVFTIDEYTYEATPKVATAPEAKGATAPASAPGNQTAMEQVKNMRANSAGPS